MSLIVNGFCKEVLKELPMEFAVEAQKLLAVQPRRLGRLRDGRMLEIRGLTAAIDGKPILKGIDLSVPAGEVHAIMGPNGSGKSTLAYVLSGREDYEVTGGSVTFDGRDLLAMEPEERAAAGLFLAFQYPVELPGVGNANFMRTALNAIRRARGEAELDAVQFLKLARAETKRLHMPDDMLKRNVNVGFSGGEKKRNEMLQMAHPARRGSRSSTRPTAGLTSTRCGSSPRASTRCAARISPRWSSPITSACSTTSCRIACTCCRTAGSCGPAGRNSRWSWRRAATPASSAEAA